MKRKTVYLYNPVTLTPTGDYEAQESPLEPGEFLLPVHCVDTPPPDAQPNQKVVFNGKDGWDVKTLPIPTETEKLEAAVEKYRIAVRQHMSAVAKASPERFNSISEAKSFVGTDNPLAAVSQAFQIWSAKVQVASNKGLASVLAGKEKLPPLDVFIKNLPEWRHP